MKLTDVEIINRVDLSDRWMKKFRDSDIASSNRYIDANAPATGSDEDWSLSDDSFNPEGDVPENIPIGQPNYLAINNETKIAAVAMSAPSLHVKVHEDGPDGMPNAGDMVAKAWEMSWEAGNWNRETQAGLQKLGICGLGMLWYRWDVKYGPCFEHVSSKRLFLDPHATNLCRMDFGGVKVRMSLRKAVQLYDPYGAKGFFDGDYSGLDVKPGEESKHLDMAVRTVSIYFDEETEAHVYNGKVLHKDKNHYERVPLLPIEGFIDPRERLLPLGDNVFASGLNQQVVDLAALAGNMAKHGGQVTLGDPNAFDVTTKQALQSGASQQIIFTKGPINPQAVPLHRVSAEQLSPAYGEARREAQEALDGIQGVTSAQRGQLVPGVTATQSVMAENRSGARPTQARSDYERWLTRMARAYVFLMQKFGGPTEEEQGTEETKTLWHAFKAVYEVRVIEGSTSYRNPAADQQAAMQLTTTLSQIYPLFMTLAKEGIVDKVPNLKQVVNDMLRAFSRQNIEQYWVPMPQQPQQQGDPVQLIRALASVYKVAPPDVRRQIEQHFGVTPSQMGDESKDDGGAGDAGKQAAQHGHEERMQQADHLHDMRLKTLDLVKETASAGSEAESLASKRIGSGKQ